MFVCLLVQALGALWYAFTHHVLPQLIHSRFSFSYLFFLLRFASRGSQQSPSVSVRQNDALSFHWHPKFLSLSLNVVQRRRNLLLPISLSVFVSLLRVCLSISRFFLFICQDCTWNAVQDHQIIDVNVRSNMKIFFHLYRKIAARPVASASSSSSSSAHGLVVPSGKRGCVMITSSMVLLHPLSRCLLLRSERT